MQHPLTTWLLIIDTRETELLGTVILEPREGPWKLWLVQGNGAARLWKDYHAWTMRILVATMTLETRDSPPRQLWVTEFIWNLRGKEGHRLLKHDWDELLATLASGSLEPYSIRGTKCGEFFVSKVGKWKSQLLHLYPWCQHRTWHSRCSVSK